MSHRPFQKDRIPSSRSIVAKVCTMPRYLHSVAACAMVGGVGSEGSEGSTVVVVVVRTHEAL